jgi:hypothetical protein
MFVTPQGDKIFVVDAHIHLWDARPENRRNRYGLTFIESFWGSHVGMTPREQRWDFDRFCHYGMAGAAKDLFEDGYVDVGIMPRCAACCSTPASAIRLRAAGENIASATRRMDASRSRPRPDGARTRGGHPGDRSRSAPLSRPRPG